LLFDCPVGTGLLLPAPVSAALLRVPAELPGFSPLFVFMTITCFPTVIALYLEWRFSLIGLIGSLMVYFSKKALLISVF